MNNVIIKWKNEMTAIVGKVEKRVGDEIHTFAKVKNYGGVIKTIFVGSRVLAPTFTN
jgi:hypothetical protein